MNQFFTILRYILLKVFYCHSSPRRESKIKRKRICQEILCGLDSDCLWEERVSLWAERQHTINTWHSRFALQATTKKVKSTFSLLLVVTFTGRNASNLVHTFCPLDSLNSHQLAHIISLYRLSMLGHKSMGTP